MELNIREMLVGHPIRLRYVFRYSTSRVQHPESVAEHSYYVCLYSLLIADWCNSRAIAVRTTDLMRRAVLHDLEESRSGDFPRPFKHSNSDLKEMLEAASVHAMEQVAEALLGKITCCNPAAAQVVETWCHAKNATAEGRILEFADFLSVLSFMHEEMGAGGNGSIRNHMEDMNLYMDKFRTKGFDFIRPLVAQAEALMLEVFPRGGRVNG